MAECDKSSQRGEHAVDHHPGLAEIVDRIAQVRERGTIQVALDLRVLGQKVEQRAYSRPM